jgi:hypothetical protein
MPYTLVDNLINGDFINGAIFKFSLFSLFEVASGGDFFHFCLETKVEQKFKAALKSLKNESSG